MSTLCLRKTGSLFYFHHEWHGNLRCLCLTPGLEQDGRTLVEKGEGKPRQDQPRGSVTCALCGAYKMHEGCLQNCSLTNFGKSSTFSSTAPRWLLSTRLHTRRDSVYRECSCVYLNMFCPMDNVNFAQFLEFMTFRRKSFKSYKTTMLRLLKPLSVL